ncbi:MAG: site-specific DNA-methyltransferase [Sedimenticola sp.]
MPYLNWLTRDEDIRTARKAPYRLLEEVPEHSAGEPSTQNMLIQGDNLEALKALLPYYAGKIKCIYIDPPYNTKSAFEHYDDSLEHTTWLAMMYPRLELLRDLLAEDGSIWVSIDDHESHYLKVLMDEVFGRSNFVANVVWQKKYTVANDARYLADNHDHLITFALNKENWKPNRLARSEAMDKRYRNPDNHPKGPWKATPLYAKRAPSEKEKAFQIIFNNGVEWRPPKGTTPRFPYDTLRQMDDNDEIWFGSDGKASPSRKTFLKELKISGTPAPTLWLHSEAGHNHEAREESKAFGSESNFDTPKPERLIQRILHIATNPGDLVLDSFLGSGTTAAVAHKMGRRYIGIEMGDHAFTHCAPRLKKVIGGEQGGISEAVEWKGGGGCRFYRLGEPVFDEDGPINPEVRFPELAAHVWFSETGSALTEKPDKPFLGINNDTAYALLYNGILGDKKVNGGNALTHGIIRLLKEQAGNHSGTWVIYGEWSPITEETLRTHQITFKQTPYDIRAR